MQMKAMKTLPKKALQFEPASMQVNLGEVSFDDSGAFFISGTRIAADENIESKMLEILGLNKQFLNKFGNLTNAESKKALIEFGKKRFIAKRKFKETSYYFGKYINRKNCECNPD